MNRCASKPPLPHAAKLVKLWAGQFYLSPADRDELAQCIEEGTFTREDQAVDFVDERGEWLDG